MTESALADREQEEVGFISDLPQEASAISAWDSADMAARPSFEQLVQETVDTWQDRKPKRRLGKRWIEELRFETEVWLAKIRHQDKKREQTEPLVEEPSSIMVPQTPVTQPTEAPDMLAKVPQATDVPAEAAQATEAPAEAAQTTDEVQTRRTWVEWLQSATSEVLETEEAKSALVAPLPTQTESQQSLSASPTASWIASL